MESSSGISSFSFSSRSSTSSVEETNPVSTANNCLNSANLKSMFASLCTLGAPVLKQVLECAKRGNTSIEITTPLTDLDSLDWLTNLDSYALKEAHSIVSNFINESNSIVKILNDTNKDLYEEICLSDPSSTGTSSSQIVAKYGAIYLQQDGEDDTELMTHEQLQTYFITAKTLAEGTVDSRNTDLTELLIDEFEFVEPISSVEAEWTMISPVTPTQSSTSNQIQTYTFETALLDSTVRKILADNVLAGDADAANLLGDVYTKLHEENKNSLFYSMRGTRYDLRAEGFYKTAAELGHPQAALKYAQLLVARECVDEQTFNDSQSVLIKGYFDLAVKKNIPGAQEACHAFIEKAYARAIYLVESIQVKLLDPHLISFYFTMAFDAKCEGAENRRLYYADEISRRHLKNWTMYDALEKKQAMPILILAADAGYPAASKKVGKYWSIQANDKNITSQTRRERLALAIKYYQQAVDSKQNPNGKQLWRDKLQQNLTLQQCYLNVHDNVDGSHYKLAKYIYDINNFSNFNTDTLSAILDHAKLANEQQKEDAGKLLFHMYKYCFQRKSASQEAAFIQPFLQAAMEAGNNQAIQKFANG